jgi:hypothetical protein
VGPSLSPRARGSDSPLALRLLRATTRWSSERREAGVLEETHDNDQIIQRVAALDIGKAELTCCVRVPGQGSSGRRLQDGSTPTGWMC